MILKFFIQLLLFALVYLYYILFTEVQVTPNAYIFLFPIIGTDQVLSTSQSPQKFTFPEQMIIHLTLNRAASFNHCLWLKISQPPPQPFHWAKTKPRKPETTEKYL